MQFFMVPSFLPWIEPDDYEAFKRLMPDNPDIPDTYDKWRDLTLEEIAEQRAMGFAVETVVVYPFEFFRYCHNGNAVPNSAALLKFACQKATLSRA
jgi:hypothetical protein